MPATKKTTAAKTPAKASAKTRKPAARKAAPAERNLISEVLPEGARTEAPKSGTYYRVLVGDKSIGYVSTRRHGLLLEVLTSRLADAPADLLEGTGTRQNQTVLLITEANLAQGRDLLAHAAGTVA